VNQHDLLGWVLEVIFTDADGVIEYSVRGRCVGAWPDGGVLLLALAREDGEVLLGSIAVPGVGRSRLRILRDEGRKVSLA
jgi:hypothetical protein